VGGEGGPHHRPDGFANRRGEAPIGRDLGIDGATSLLQCDAEPLPPAELPHSPGGSRSNSALRCRSDWRHRCRAGVDNVTIAFRVGVSPRRSVGVGYGTADDQWSAVAQGAQSTGLAYRHRSRVRSRVQDDRDIDIVQRAPCAEHHSGTFNVSGPKPWQYAT
jgi:hypothetical protein